MLYDSSLQLFVMHHILERQRSNMLYVHRIISRSQLSDKYRKFKLFFLKKSITLFKSLLNQHYVFSLTATTAGLNQV